MVASTSVLINNMDSDVHADMDTDCMEDTIAQVSSDKSLKIISTVSFSVPPVTMQLSSRKKATSAIVLGNTIIVPLELQFF